MNTSKVCGNDIVGIIGCGGIGDLILSQQCGHLISQGYDPKRPLVYFYYPVRDEVFRVIQYLFPLNSHQISEEYDRGNNFEKDEKYRDMFKKDHPYLDIVYWVVPDLLFVNNYAFNYKKYNIDIQTIKSTRVLLNSRYPAQKIIYCALATSTPNYHYPYLRQLFIDLAGALPSHTIYFPNITKWGGKELSFGDLTNLPSNIYIHDNPDFIESLEVLKKSEYCICTCNGTSHISYHLGIPRLILDPQFERPAWVARWKENESECIDRLIDPGTIARIVKTNIEMPQTSLIDRKYLLYDQDWERVLMLKKY